jgi:hypothetical protein
MIIRLHWPDHRLLPNRRRGKRLFDTTIIAGHREDARLSALEALGRARPKIPKDHILVCKIQFHPPDRRRRDLDGMLSACKPFLDGIADAMGIDDHQLNPLILERLDPVPNGVVIFEI